MASRSPARAHSLPRSTERATTLRIEYRIGLPCETLWRELEATQQRVPATSRWEWISTLAAGAHVQSLVAFDGDRCVGILPLVGERTRNPFRLRRLRSLGYSGEFESRTLTEESTALIRPGESTRFWLAAEQGLARLMRQEGWDCCVIVRDQTRTRAARGIGWSRHKAGPNIVQLPGTWEAFKKSLSRSMRDNLTYYERLAARKGFAVDFEIAATASELESAVAGLVELHHRRASIASKARADYFAQPHQGELFRTGLKKLASEGSAFIATVRIDGRLAAAQAFMRSGNELTASYSGFEPDLAEFSPLFILQSRVIRSAIEGGVRSLDLLPGRSSWQARWRPIHPYPMERAYRLRMNPMVLLRASIYLVCRDIHASIRRTGLPARVGQWLERRCSVLSLVPAGPWRNVAMHLATSTHIQHAHHLVRLHAR